MSKKKMLEARDLIKQKRYQEARAILETLDHPKADEWLTQLDRIPAAKKGSKRTAAKQPTRKRASASSSAGSRLLRSLLLLIVLVGVVAAVVVVAPRFVNRGGGGGGASAANNTLYANYMPADTALYATLRTDDGYINELNGILQRVVNALPEGALPAGVPTSIPAFFDQAVQQLDPEGSFNTTVRSWLGERAAFSIKVNGDILGVVGITNKANAVAALDKLGQGLFQKTEEGEYTLYTLPQGSGIIAVGGALAFVSNKRDSLPLSGAPAANLSANAEFMGAVATLPLNTGYNLVVYADLPTILDNTTGVGMRQTGQSPDILQSVGALVVGGALLDGRSLVLDVVSKAGDLTALTEQGFVLPTTGATNPSFLANIPANAALVTHGTNLKAVYEGLIANLRAAAQQGSSQGLDEAQIDTALEQLDQAIQTMTGGLNLEADILSWMTGDYAAYVVYNAPEVGVPFISADDPEVELGLGFGIVMATTDATKAQTLVDNLGTMLEGIGASLGATVSRETINGANAVSVQMPFVGASPLDVVLAADQNIFVFGTRASVTTVLNGGGFNGSPKYGEAQRYLLPSPTSFWFADTNAMTLLADTAVFTLLSAQAVITSSFTSPDGTTTANEPEVVEDFTAQLAEIQTQLRQAAGLVSSASISTATNAGGDALLRAVITLTP